MRTYGKLSEKRGLTLESDTVVRKTVSYYTDSYVNNVIKVINHFINNPHPMVVPVYECRVLERDDERTKYTYTMERMRNLNTFEMKVIEKSARWSTRFLENPESYLLDQGLVVYKDTPIVSFMIQVLKDDKYIDLHNGNIMVDQHNNYRLIDLEGFVCHSEPRNAWFH